MAARARRGGRSPQPGAAVVALPPWPHRQPPECFAAALTLAVLGLYGATTRWGLGGGDSGELTLSAYTLGVAHPPGYPLWTLLGKAFTYLPWGSLAWRLNFFSAVADAAAAGLLFAALARLRGSLAVALTGSGLWAFSPLIWRYATVAEVFALHNLFVCGLLYGCARLVARPTPSGVLGCLLWLGCGLGHHQTLIFYALFVVPWLLTQLSRTACRPQFFMRAALALGVGFTPYVYLVVAGRATPLLGWSDTSTLNGFLRHFFRADYGTFALSSSATAGEGSLPVRLGHYLSTWPQELSLGGLGCVVVALTTWWHRRRQVGLGPAGLCALGAAAFATYVTLFTALNNMRVDPLSLEVQGRFYQQANVLLCVAAGLGLGAGLGWLPSHLGRWRGAVGGVLSVLLVLAQVGRNLPPRAVTRSHVLEDFGRACLSVLPPQTLLVFTGDHILGTLRYMQIATGLRPDVDTMDAGQLGYGWSPKWLSHNFPRVRLPPGRVRIMAPRPGYDLGELARANLPHRPVFLLNWQSSWDQSIDADFTQQPWGFARQLLPQGSVPDEARFTAANEQTFAQFDLEALRPFGEATWEHYVAQQYWEGVQFYGSQRLIRAFAHEPAQRGEVLRAVGLLEAAAQQAPIVGPDVYKNLGVAYHYLSASTPDYSAKMVRAWRRYLEVRPRDGSEEAHAAAIEQIVERASGPSPQSP